MTTQYATEGNLSLRQRLWDISERRPPFSLHSWVIGLARLSGGERVLDVGCGNGRYLELVDAVGLDRSPGMLSSARARTKGPLVAGDAACLPLANDTFDVALALHMLYHVPDRGAAAHELRRVVRPGGVLIAVTNGRATQRELVELFEEVVGGGWRWERPAESAFSLENGGPQLQAAFERVEVVTCPSGRILITDAGAVGDYLQSMRDFYEAQIGARWDDLIDAVVDRVAATIGAEGAFVVTPVVGAFVCS
ncbi:MAG TPA: class I SAM-dependent methyltransferase [Acidimicrobiales bacterium]